MKIERMKANTTSSRQSRIHLRSGFTLVITLILLAAVVMLVIGMFSSTTLESRITRNYDSGVQAQMALESGLARASQLLRAATWSESGVIYPAASDITNPNVRSAQHLVGAVPRLEAGEVRWSYIPLVSGIVEAVPEFASSDPEKLHRVFIQPNGSQGSSPLAEGFPKTLPWQPSPTAYWETVREPTAEEAREGMPSSRFCFWVDDMQGYVDLASAGNFGSAVNPMDEDYGGLAVARKSPHERERFLVKDAPAAYTSPREWYQGLVPGLRTPDDDLATIDRHFSQNQVSLFALFSPTLAADAVNYDNELVIARAYPLLRQGVIVPTNLLFSQDVWKHRLTEMPGAPISESGFVRFTDRNAPTDDDKGRLTNPVARRVEENSVTGNQSYLEMPVIPPYPDPAFAGVLEPKMNLNRVLTQIQRGEIAAGGAVTNGAWSPTIGVDLIAKHIHEHLPLFSERSGGFPMGGSLDERKRNYLRNLAAGMIDYGDTDCLPTMDQIGNNYANWGRFYRGSDSYPLVSEQFMRVKWEAVYNEGTRKKVRVSVTFFYELWNMSNRLVEAEFDAAYMTEGRLQAGTANITLKDLTRATSASRPPAVGGYNWMPLLPPLATNTDTLPNGTVDRNQKVVRIPANGYVVLANVPVVFEADAGPSSSFIQSIEVQRDDASKYCIRMRPANRTNQVPPILLGAQQQAVPPLVAGSVIDLSRGTLERYPRTLQFGNDPKTKQRFNVTLPGHSYGNNNSAYANNVGDPRSSFYINYSQEVVNYPNGASPWGQTFRSNVGGDPIHKSTRIDRWPDLGHNNGPNTASAATPSIAWGLTINTVNGDFIDDISPHHPDILARRNTLLGSEPTADPLAWEKRAPMRISNTGRFFSVTELGHIFDPVMWDANGSGSDANVTWSDHADIRGGSEAIASEKFCGGNTLRIGRMDHTRFRPDWASVIGGVDNAKHFDGFAIGPQRGAVSHRGLVATALLDLFHCGIPIVDGIADGINDGPAEEENLRDLTGPLIEVRGHVNINTATRDTLTAIIAGESATDPVYPATKVENGKPGDQSAPRPPTLMINGETVEAGLIADRIIQSRQNAPFLSVAELSERIVANSKKSDGTLNTTIKPILGDPRTDYVKPAVTPVGLPTDRVEWSDPAMEEVFARIYNNSTVRSRNFRVFVTGQALKPRRSDPTQMEVLGTRSRVFHVFVKPIRDPETGVLVDQKIEITHVRDL